MQIKMVSAKLWGLCRKSALDSGSWRVCSDAAVNLASRKDSSLGGDGAGGAWKVWAGEVQQREGS